MQVWQGPSTSALRTVSGTASVSPACNAPFLWWDEASSLSVTTFCAPTAAGKSDNPTVAVHYQCGATIVKTVFSFKHAIHKLLLMEAFYGDL